MPIKTTYLRCQTKNCTMPPTTHVRYKDIYNDLFCNFHVIIIDELVTELELKAIHDKGEADV